jgi:hypothetical protein
MQSYRTGPCATSAIDEGLVSIAVRLVCSIQGGGIICEIGGGGGGGDGGDGGDGGGGFGGLDPDCQAACDERFGNCMDSMGDCKGFWGALGCAFHAFICRGSYGGCIQDCTPPPIF